MAASPKQGRIAIDGDAIRRMRERKFAWTRQELASRIKRSESAIAKIESGETKEVYLTTLQSLAAAFGMSIEETMSEFAARGEWDQNIEPYSRVDLVPIPTFELSIAAGGWSDASELGELDYDSQQSIVNQGLFRIKLRGDSMTPKYKEGETIEFKMVRRDGNGGLFIGRDYAIFNNAQEATFKRLEAVEGEGDDRVYVLRPLNSKKYKDPLRIHANLVVAAAMAVARVEVLGEE